MNEFLHSKLFYVSLTLVVYVLTNLLYKRFPYRILHPALLSILLLIAYLKISKGPFELYNSKTQLITFWLGPSVVALGLPLYLYIRQLNGQFIRIFGAMLCGSVAGIISVVLIAKLLGASDVVLLSLAAKSITTPIAMEITQNLGGNVALTIAVVFITGFTGALFGLRFLKLIGIKNPLAIGLAIGSSSHAVGTAEVVKNGEEQVAFSALGMVMNGILTAIIAPLIVPHLISLI